jgi:hypothetical protein
MPTNSVSRLGSPSSSSNDLAEIAIEFVERATLAMCARESGNVADVQPGFGIALNDCGITFHELAFVALGIYAIGVRR